ncbi:hypothetical protein E2C01_049179 [Portunus trituberculatus]|uniref:Uncharacterized protein n=1 Tax=Portunus trituberculatus TaxID=210409 RepID=A0A5B7GD61_PORTR|nr:hypothetical protein [Portunus trituberculatus]
MLRFCDVTISRLFNTRSVPHLCLFLVAISSEQTTPVIPLVAELVTIATRVASDMITVLFLSLIRSFSSRAS